MSRILRAVAFAPNPVCPISIYFPAVGKIILEGLAPECIPPVSQSSVSKVRAVNVLEVILWVVEFLSLQEVAAVATGEE
jgi:hypothetical protein